MNKLGLALALSLFLTSQVTAGTYKGSGPCNSCPNPQEYAERHRDDKPSDKPQGKTIFAPYVPKWVDETVGSPWFELGTFVFALVTTDLPLGIAALSNLPVGLLVHTYEQSQKQPEPQKESSENGSK